jgi:hypothetical protein
MRSDSFRPAVAVPPIFEWGFRGCFGAFAIWLILILGTVPKLEGDTLVVIQGWNEIVACIRSGNFAPCPTESYFAPLQTIAVTPVKLLRAGDRAVLRVFAFISVVGSVLLLCRGYRVLKRNSKLCARLLLLAALGSPLLYYAGSSFSELWLCCLLMLLVESCVSGHPVRIAILTFLAGSAKETAPPFVLVLALCSLFWASPDRNRYTKKIWLYPLGGTAAAVLLNVSLNVFRYRSVWNAVMWEEMRQVRNASDYFSFFLGMWFSPTGGFFLYWPTLALCTILGCAGILIHYRDKKRVDSRVLPFAAMCVFQFVLTLSLAKWHAPFGWVCWGSRLHLPWILPTAFLLWIVYTKETEAFAQRYFGSIGLRIFIGLVLGIFSLPHLFVTIDWRVPLDVFRATDVCPRAPDVPEIAYYYKCMHEYLWPISPTLVRSFGLISWDMRTIAVSGLYLCTCVFGFAGLPIATDD